MDIPLKEFPNIALKEFLIHRLILFGISEDETFCFSLLRRMGIGPANKVRKK